MRMTKITLRTIMATTTGILMAMVIPMASAGITTAR
jgi:hypothetical protein